LKVRFIPAYERHKNVFSWDRYNILTPSP
jgi:hypothetical protein